MIPSQQHLFLRYAETRGDREHESSEIRRTHARIAAVLIDLIGGGLDQDRAEMLSYLVQSGLDHQGMRGARAVDTDGTPCFVLRNYFPKCLHAMITSTPIRASSSRAESGMPASVTSFLIPCGSRILCRQIRPNLEESATTMISEAARHIMRFSSASGSKCVVMPFSISRPSAAKNSFSTCRSCSACSVCVP